jgi:hypothetical protein
MASDRTAATAWLSDEMADADVAPIVVAHAGMLAREDPVTAIAWIENVPDVELRSRSLVEIERIWQRKDPDAAARWRERAGPEDDISAPSPPVDLTGADANRDSD